MEPWSDFRLAIATAAATAMPTPLLTRLRHYLPTNLWKVLAILFALLNLKSLPLAWHLRLLRGLLLQSLNSRRRLVTRPGARALFAPMITATRTSPLECDYNLHKSNSTYFSDFDVGRLHLLVALLGHGVQVTRRELWTEMPERRQDGFMVALGGVAVNFRREIKPLEKAECWTRILAWDQKWLYVVGHFVRPGTVRVGGQVLGKMVAGEKGWRRRGKDGGEDEKPVIYASAIAKYVCKKGRLTIPPERVLRASKLLPPKPEEGGETPLVEHEESNGAAVDGVTAMPVAEAAVETLTLDNSEDLIDESMLAPDDGEDNWDWARVERERLRGMKMARVYSDLDGLSAEAPEHGSMVLGRY